MLRVAVIGAGSAGLAAAQQLRAVAGAHAVQVVVYETRDRVGGLWQYTPEPGPCSIHVPTSPEPGDAGYATWDAWPDDLCPSAMYEDLRTNIPSTLMAFRDHPFPPTTAMFPVRAEVLSYLESFARHYDLLSCIRFQTRVVRASKYDGAWQVTSRSTVAPQAERTDTYDCLIAAQGRCSAPYIPPIPGLAHFRGRQLHSAWYRYPDALHTRRVLIVGNNSSGADIARELCGGSVRTWPHQADWHPSSVTVFQSYHNVAEPPPMDYDPRDPASPAWCRRIHVVSSIERIDDSGAILLRDGQRLEGIDLIVWATGFLYQLPFFDPTEAPFAEAPLLHRDAHTRTAPTARAASVLHHLDDWMLLYKADPTLCFLGLPNRIVPFPFTQLQARAVAHIWLGLMPPLPRVHAMRPVDDPQRWKPWPASRAEEAEALPGPDVHGHFTLGAEAEHAYTDALLALLPVSARNDKVWTPYSAARRALRKAGKQHRRDQLGY